MGSRMRNMNGKCQLPRFVHTDGKVLTFSEVRKASTLITVHEGPSGRVAYELEEMIQKKCSAMTEYPVVLWRKNGARYADDDGDREKQFGYCARVFVRAFKVVDMLFYPPSHARANRIAFVKFANNALWVRIVYGYADVSFDA